MSEISSNGEHKRQRSRFWFGRLGRGIESSIVRSGTIFANVTSLGIIIMILIGTIDVIGTKFFNAPVPTAYEATESLMLLVTFGGFAFVQHQKRNIKVDLLVRHFSPRAKIVSELAGNLIGLIFFGALTWRSALFFWHSYKIKEYAEALVPFPIYPTKFVMLLGGGLVSLQLLVDVFQTARGLGVKNTPSPDV
jgi:TRAP-type C4-dicarboxylate transport system permease small subunit